MLTPDRVPRLHKLLWPTGMPGSTRVFALLDGARNAKVFGTVDASRQDKTCLFSATSRWYPTDLKWEVIGIAPYLLELDPDDKFTSGLLRNAWDDNWGIFLRAASSIDKLRRHLRQFLNIYTDAGKLLMFRYYDPRVLRVYLPTCNGEELRAFFGPVSAFLLPARDPDTAIRFSLSGRELLTCSWMRTVVSGWCLLPIIGFASKVRLKRPQI